MANRQVEVDMSGASRRWKLRFTLPGLFAAVTVVAVAVAFSRSSWGQWLASHRAVVAGGIALLWIGGLILAHVAGNYWGERINPQLRQSGEVPDPETLKHFRRAVPRGWRASVPETHLRSRERIHLALWSLVALGAALGAWAGVRFVQYMTSGEVNTAGLVLGGVSAAVLGGVWTFLIATCVVGIVRGLRESARPIEVQLHKPSELQDNSPLASADSPCRADPSSGSSV